MERVHQLTMNYLNSKKYESPFPSFKLIFTKVFSFWPSNTLKYGYYKATQQAPTCDICCCLLCMFADKLSTVSLVVRPNDTWRTLPDMSHTPQTSCDGLRHIPRNVARYCPPHPPHTQHSLRDKLENRAGRERGMTAWDTNTLVITLWHWQYV